jgi:predicted GNAT family N-acyltransferase
MTFEAAIVRFDQRHSPQIRAIRNAVFTLGQGIDEAIDFDGQDPDALHVLVSVGDKVVATGRLLNDGHIGRLAVLEENRGQGAGTHAVRALVHQAQRLGLKRVYLGSQMQAVDFYRGLGFRERGEPFMEAGIEHIEMERTFTP